MTGRNQSNYMINKTLYTIVLLTAICCGQCRPKNHAAETIDNIVTGISRMRIVSDETLRLSIYYPDFDKIDLVCGEMPSAEDTSVIFCCEAAFTGQLLSTFSHMNIAGNHVSDGEYFNGYNCRSNTGGFTYDGKKWLFFLSNHEANLMRVAQSGGMGFEQNMVIFEGVKQPLFRMARSAFEYRTLCELDGDLCIIDSKDVVRYDEYVEMLLKLGVHNALYLDMGPGWNYAFYRTNDGSLHTLHTPPAPGYDYRTNWVTFYKSGRM